MLKENDLDAPAELTFAPLGSGGETSNDWSHARTFGSLREAVHWAMTNESPAGTHAAICAASGAVLGPSHLEEIWASLQGP